jgi:TetR/AcrR family transcriptional regulator, cholesterol catabolism regulator
MKKRYLERVVETKVKDDDLVKQRREQIIQAASNVFVKKGYHLATIRDISEVSNLGPGTIYNYVKRKEDILYLIYNKLTTMLTETLLETIKKNADPLEQLKQGLKKTVDIVWDNQDLILLMYQETGALDKDSIYNILHRESNYVKHMEKILEMGREKGGICNKNTRMAADIIVYLLAFIPLRRWNLRGRFNENEIKSGLIDFILEALCIRGRKNKK